MRVTSSRFLSHVKENCETGKVHLLDSNKSEMLDCPYFKVVDLHKFMESIYINLSDKLSDGPGLYDKIWILFAGDKGGSFMKSHY